MAKRAKPERKAKVVAHLLNKEGNFGNGFAGFSVRGMRRRESNKVEKHLSIIIVRKIRINNGIKILSLSRCII